jgi:hypothetical protein
VDSSKTESSSPPCSPSERAVAPRSSTSTDSECWRSAGFESEWHYRFALLSATLARQMISGDQIRLIAYSLEHQAGEDVAHEFLEHAVLNRSKTVHGFMG